LSRPNPGLEQQFLTPGSESRSQFGCVGQEVSKNRANMRRRVESGDDVSFAVIHNDFSTAGREMLYSFL